MRCAAFPASTLYAVFGFEARLDIREGSTDQLAKRCGIHLTIRTQFHMSHALATSIQEVGRVREECAVEETDIDMARERVDVGERRVFDARDGTTIVHHFSDCITALSHPRKPLLRN